MDYAAAMPEVARLIWGAENQQLSSAKELRWGNKGSRSVNLAKGTWFDHEANEGGGVTDLLKRDGLNPAEWLSEHGFGEAHKPNGGYGPAIAATFDYTDELGNFLFQVVRYEPKRFLQRRRPRDGDDPAKIKGGWVYSVEGVTLVPYRLHEVIEEVALGRTIYIPEGEKHCDRLWSMGLPATCNVGGAKKWRPEYSEWLRGADVVVLPDNDSSGSEHGEQVAASLNGIAASVRVAALPGLKPKGDILNWLAAGGTGEALQAIVAKTPLWTEAGPAGPGFVLTSAEFAAGFVPPDWMIYRILQRHYFYSLTASTGSGKTALGLALAMHVALGRPLGDLSVKPGRVLYLAGENPDDIRARWIAMADRFSFDLASIGVFFVPGKFRIADQRDRIAEAAARHGGFSLVEIDTSATYFEGEEENSNVQLLQHAQMMRSLTDLPGRPCVVTYCHPTKAATAENMLPRGGGSFLAEVDGNLTATKDGTSIEMHWQGKIRGPDFSPLSFELIEVNSDKLLDVDGRPTPTVIAKHISGAEFSSLDEVRAAHENSVLKVMLDNPNSSLAELATALGWFGRDGAPNKQYVGRIVKKFADLHIAVKGLRNWELTDRGRKIAQNSKI